MDRIATSNDVPLAFRDAVPVTPLHTLSFLDATLPVASRDLYGYPVWNARHTG